jgi:hypothetical protein
MLAAIIFLAASKMLAARIAAKKNVSGKIIRVFRPYSNTRPNQPYSITCSRLVDRFHLYV